jgi:hypothetical protein
MFMVSIDVYAESSCVVELSFLTMPEKKQQILPVADGVELALMQMVASKGANGAKISSNFICQKMKGATYTGSNEEWQNFINSAMQGLSSSGYINVQFVPVVPADKVYKTEFQSIEYGFVATKAGNTQHIHNLALLDKAKNTVYTISVSGNETVKAEVLEEFKRLVNTFMIKQ